RAARHGGPGRVEHQPHALAPPALLQLGRELHLPVAARRRLHLAVMRLEPAADEAAPVRRLRGGLATRDGRLLPLLAVPVAALAVRGPAVGVGAAAAVGRPAVRRGSRPGGGAASRGASGRRHERSSSDSFAPWNSMLWLSRCCW